MRPEPVTADPLLDEIRGLVEHIAGASRTPPDAGPETRLTEGYWLDSIELLELIIACEAKLGITFDERQDFEGGALDTLGSLTRLIRLKLSSVGRAP